MSLEAKAGIIVGIFIVLIIVVLIIRRTPRKLKTDKFALKWKELQKFCRDKSTWPHAIKAADKLLDEALKRRKYSGKSMGERMVSAQRTFKDNDAVWFAHNLSKKILTDPTARIKETDVKEALMGYRQALRDIGALPSEKSDN